MKCALIVVLAICSALPLPAVDTPCDVIVARIESGGTALSRSLTGTLCTFAAKQRWIAAADADAVRTRNDLRVLLRKRSGQDVIDAGAQMFVSFERAAGNSVGTTWQARDTDHYRLFVRPGSAAAQDLDLIAADAERSRAGLVEAFGLEPILRSREAVVRTKQPAGIEHAQPSNRIAIYLYANRQDDTDKRVGPHSMGATSFSATIDESGRGRLQPSIHVLYYNPISLSVVEHEIAHTLVMMAAFDAAAIDKPLSGAADLKRAFFAGYRPMPAFLNEGFAGYGLYYAGCYSAWGLLGSPEELAVEGKLPPLDKLLRANHLDARQSLAAATFLRYLMNIKGAEAVRQWLLSADVASFQTIMGIAIDEAERGWLQRLRGARASE